MFGIRLFPAHFENGQTLSFGEGIWYPLFSATHPTSTSRCPKHVCVCVQIYTKCVQRYVNDIDHKQKDTTKSNIVHVLNLLLFTFEVWNLSNPFYPSAFSLWLKRVPPPPKKTPSNWWYLEHFLCKLTVRRHVDTTHLQLKVASFVHRVPFRNFFLFDPIRLP